MNGTMEACVEGYWKSSLKDTISKIAAENNKTPEEVLSYNMRDFSRNGDIDPKLLDQYLGERGVCFMIDVMNGLFVNKHYLDVNMLVLVTEHLVEQLKEKDQTIRTLTALNASRLASTETEK